MTEEGQEKALPTVQKTPSSSKKKKAKKEKRKSRGGDGGGDNGEVFGTESAVKRSKTNDAETPGSKKKKDKKKKDKKKSRDSSVVVDEVISQQSTPLATSSTAVTKSTTTAATTSNPKSIFSLISTPSSNSLAAMKNSPYQIKTILGTVALLPTSLSNVSSNIQSLLHSLLLMYDANMGGVLLSLEEGVTLLPLDYDVEGSTGNSAIVSEDERNTGGRKKGGGGGWAGGRIVDDLPYVHYKFRTKGLLFCPVVGMKLKGQVIECTPTFITLTTHHILSTKISTEKLHQQGFFYNSVTLEWTRERGSNGDNARDGVNGEGNEEEDDDGVLGPSTSIYLDDTVEFVVERIYECGGLISLDGGHPSVSAM